MGKILKGKVTTARSKVTVMSQCDVAHSHLPTNIQSPVKLFPFTHFYTIMYVQKMVILYAENIMCYIIFTILYNKLLIYHM